MLDQSDFAKPLLPMGLSAGWVSLLFTQLFGLPRASREIWKWSFFACKEEIQKLLLISSHSDCTFLYPA